MEDEALTAKIIGCAMVVHSALGPGFLESVYRNALAHELNKSGLKIAREKPIGVLYDGVVVGEFSADILVEEKVMLELKANHALVMANEAQLVNIYLHEVFDRWFAEVVRERMEGRVFAVRYADDLVIGFSHRRDAERVYRVIFQRFEKYGLTLHPEKTRLVEFGRPDSPGPEGGPPGNPGTFDFLGFTHYWGKSRKGYWVIKRKTASKRLARSIKAIGDWCRDNRHKGGMFEQFKILVRKLEGHYAYYGITGNARALDQVRDATVKLWHKWLRRRSRESTSMTWERMKELLRTLFVFPYARVVHSIYHAKP
jgi:GxxExxY protein